MCVCVCVLVLVSARTEKAWMSLHLTPSPLHKTMTKRYVLNCSRLFEYVCVSLCVCVVEDMIQAVFSWWKCG